MDENLYLFLISAPNSYSVLQNCLSLMITKPLGWTLLPLLRCRGRWMTIPVLLFFQYFSCNCLLRPPYCSFMFQRKVPQIHSFHLFIKHCNMVSYIAKGLIRNVHIAFYRTENSTAIEKQTLSPHNVMNEMVLLNIFLHQRNLYWRGNPGSQPMLIIILIIIKRKTTYFFNDKLHIYFY